MSAPKPASCRLAALILFTIFITTSAFAGPKFINFQGVMEFNNEPLEFATVDVTFRLYNVPELGDVFWDETILGVETKKNGKFNVKLGKAEGSEIPDSVFSEAELWLGIQIINYDPAQSEMTPRTEIGAVPYALMAKSVPDKAIGKNKLDTLAVDSSKIADRAIRKENIKDRAIGKSQLDTLAVDSSKIADRAIRKENIKDKAVGKAQLDTLAVDSSKIADRAIRKENIKDKAIGKAQLDTLAVDSAKIADKGVRLKNLAQSDATEGQVMKWSDNPTPGWYPADEDPDDHDWVLADSDFNTLYTAAEWGIARWGNILYGPNDSTHVNLGVACTTGKSGSEVKFATVSGGRGNTAEAQASTIGGGQDNHATGQYSVISGGADNIAGGEEGYNTVGGGAANRASGLYATVPGGTYNSAEADYSFAAGTLAKAKHIGSIVIAANNADGGAVFDPSDSVWTDRGEQLVLRADSGFYLTDKSEEANLGPQEFLSTSTGATLKKSGLWTDYSDRNAKENYTDIDRDILLKKIAALPISQWNFKIDDDKIKHIGPVAQDFYAVFGIGYDDKSIAAIDEAGIALAAIQELYKKTQRIEQLEEKLERLQKQLEKLIAENK